MLNPKQCVGLLFAVFFTVACVPKIQLETPKEGITINMNVEVEHKIQIETDENTRKILGE
ncbi:MULTISPECIES: YnbE family lipoprotein [Testudinibacter]|nr:MULTISPECIES: YnbE family lipoprotein [Testudinibacter]TNG93257.1 YnbE family lipoprotein [Pasteurellaceae bacterium UScroc12]TNG97053.1 YnbE family lipoprotein [Pasteurellaceae bacterium UScroc31]TNG97402.1 YnbE family lipoprotein [Pasteurellaceae bacterium USgator41]TNH00714.1 YnbE family lipoprotein [Pasteurellaceae bacterium USgator11]TNH06528.1 YnbE family lipoprotein [Pasteurellaceae bacterium Phil11]